MLYVNHLPNCLAHSKPNLLADDTNISTSSECIKDLERLNLDLENIYQWLVSNRLTLDLTKTEYMIIGSRHRLKKIELNPEIKIGGQSVKRVKTTKCLGMIIDDKLRWDGHVDQVSKNVSWG